LLAAIGLVGYLVWQSPHAVHHAFDLDQDSRDECPFAASADRVQAAIVEAIATAPVADPGCPIGPPAARSAPTADAGSPGARAPPVPAS
jgi:hypothetical protein